MKCLLSIPSERPYSADHFERKLFAKISPSDQSFEKQEEEFIEFKWKHHGELRQFSSGPIQNLVLTTTSEHTSSGYQSEGKYQAKRSKFPSFLLPSDQFQAMLYQYFESLFQSNISPSDQSFEKQE